MFNLEQAITDWRRQMLAAGIKSPVPLDELESHLRKEVEQQMQSRLDPLEAFHLAVQNIGSAHALKNEFKKVKVTKTQEVNMINHNRLYSVILAVFAICSIISGGLCLFLAGVAHGGTLGIRVPVWTLPWWAALHFAYAAAMVATLFTRQFRPDQGRRLTRILNWALLPVLGGGTILGCYGLWKVDKEKLEYV